MKTLIQTLILALLAGAMIYFFAQSREETTAVSGENEFSEFSELKPNADYAPIWESLMEASE